MFTNFAVRDLGTLAFTGESSRVSMALCGLPNEDLWAMEEHIWLVVSTPLKNISQIGSSSQLLGKIKHVPNHQPDIYSKSQHMPWTFQALPLKHPDQKVSGSRISAVWYLRSKTSIRTDFNGFDIETQNGVPLCRVTIGDHELFLES